MVTSTVAHRPGEVVKRLIAQTVDVTVEGFNDDAIDVGARLAGYRWLPFVNVLLAGDERPIPEPMHGVVIVAIGRGLGFVPCLAQGSAVDHSANVVQADGVIEAQIHLRKFRQPQRRTTNSLQRSAVGSTIPGLSASLR